MYFAGYFYFMHILSKNTAEFVESIQERYPELSQFEALQIALGVDRNDAIREAFGVLEDNSQPRFLEAIAMALGYSRL